MRAPIGLQASGCQGLSAKFEDEMPTRSSLCGCLYRKRVTIADPYDKAVLQRYQAAATFIRDAMVNQRVLQVLRCRNDPTADPKLALESNGSSPSDDRMRSATLRWDFHCAGARCTAVSTENVFPTISTTM